MGCKCSPATQRLLMLPLLLTATSALRDQQKVLLAYSGMRVLLWLLAKRKMQSSSGASSFTYKGGLPLSLQVPAQSTIVLLRVLTWVLKLLPTPAELSEFRTASCTSAALECHLLVGA